MLLLVTKVIAPNLCAVVIENADCEDVQLYCPIVANEILVTGGLLDINNLFQTLKDTVLWFTYVVGTAIVIIVSLVSCCYPI